MKKITFIIMASLMVFGLTQCKKNEQPANVADDGDRVSISLKIENVGQKVSITEDGALAYVNFDNGDVMYVGSDGKYVGYLTYTNGLFTGSISAEATEGEPLQFIMMGGRDFHETLTENLSTEWTFSLSDQSTSLAVVSTEVSNEPFSLTNLNYTSYLRNKCALVKFDLGSVSTDAAITLTGMKNEVTVGFDGTVTNGTATGDIITNGTGSTRYAVVLSDQEAVTEGTLTADGYEGTFTMPAAYTNAYLTNTSMTLTEITVTNRTTPLTFEAVTAGSTVMYTGSAPTLEYKTNNGAWTAYTSGTSITLANVGDKVSFRGNNTTVGGRFSCTGQCYLYGNIMSLLSKDDFANAETLTQGFTFGGLFLSNTAICNHPEKEIVLPAKTLANACYSGMFIGCTGLTEVPELPATTLARDCYWQMFSGCTGLTTAPELPATTLASGCYSSMFNGCTGLTTIPELPATTLASNCYSGMFNGCTSLTTAPELPATTLASGCYSSMFIGCTGLTTVPELPATTLASGCYSSMFNGCTGLTTVPELPATTLASGCYSSMFNGCTGLTTALDLPATVLASACYYKMFSGCTGLTTAPELPANTLADECYYEMFSGCTGLTTAPELPATTLADECYYAMFYGCTGLTTAPELPATTLATRCYDVMFYVCTGLTTAPELPATTLAEGCYEAMFADCTSLTNAPELPATTMAGFCYNNMFYGCTGLMTVPELPATTLASNCYSGMFNGCTSLTTAPELPATTLEYRCYSGMFNGCTSLTTAPELPATSLTPSCYASMFCGCTGLTTAPELPATTLDNNCYNCYNSMFSGCTNLNSMRCLATDISGFDCTTDWLDGVASTGTFTKAVGVNWPSGSSGIPTGWTIIEQ